MLLMATEPPLFCWLTPDTCENGYNNAVGVREAAPDHETISALPDCNVLLRELDTSQYKTLKTFETATCAARGDGMEYCQNV